MNLPLSNVPNHTRFGKEGVGGGGGGGGVMLQPVARAWLGLARTFSTLPSFCG